ncbi:hypothetical protein SLEP1_g9873 [Rubroshorea leprosula]|uniref:Uncharacterized protein n=1 Tax=Rubroshorea leprosula TaxID=152421 RepID=A0AAV5IFN7_9ROSI|nr:hypothetical protein SLEP1_g9873 [Rubroshorea leprosula]
MPPRVLIIIGLVLGYNISPPMKKFEGSENFQRAGNLVMAGNPSTSGSIPTSASGSVSVTASGSVSITASGFVPIFTFGFAPISASDFVPSSASGSVSSSASGSVPVSASGGSPVDDVGVLPSSSEPEFFDIFCLPHNADGKFCCEGRFTSAASKNNTIFIASILLSSAPPNAPPIPTAEIVKGGETGNAAWDATIASMRRKPRSVSVRGWRNSQIEIMRRS